MSTEPDRSDLRIAGGLQGEGGKQCDAEPTGHESLSDDVIVSTVADVGQETMAGGSGCEVRATAWATGNPALVGGIGDVHVGSIHESMPGGQN